LQAPILNLIFYVILAMAMSNIPSRRLLDTTLVILLKFYNYMLTLPEIAPKAPNATKTRNAACTSYVAIKATNNFFVMGRLQR
jgi:hypothetical protein